MDGYPVIEAKGGYGGAGIGGGYGEKGAGGTIKITGGTVQKAKGSNGGAGIGGGHLGAGGTITISGGTVTAKGGNWGVGIGGGYSGNGGTITITGGKVTAIDGSNNNETSGSIFDIKGNTVIVGPDATMVGTLNCSYTNGFVLSNNATEVTMKGTATLLADMTIGTDQTLTIPTGASLTIEEKVTLTNNGAITNNGTIKNAGTITGNVSGTILIKLKESMITITPDTYTYDGTPHTPDVTVKFSSTTYEKDTDYTLTCANNTNAAESTANNPPTVTVTPIYGGKLYVDEDETVTKTFTIQRKSLSFTFSGLDSPITYDGNEHEATASTDDLVTGDIVTPTLAYQKKGEGDVFTDIEGLPKNAGNYKVIVKSVDNTNYTVDVDEENNSANFTIQKATPFYEVPTGLTATYGETLADVTLPAGWTWRDATTTSVGNVGTNKFTANLDIENYDGEASVEVSITVTPADATLSFAQPTLTITQGNAVPANELTNTHTCPVTYSSSNEAVAKVEAATGVVTVLGVGTTTITATAQGNYTGSASYILTVNSYIPPYIPPTPDPDPIYYTVTIPTEVAGAIIHGGGTHEVEEYTYCSFRIELDPNGNGEYPTVTKGYWWDTLTPDGQGNYSVYVTGDTQITIGEVPTNSYDYYQVTLPTDSVAEANDQYWSGDYIEVTGASPLRAAEEASLSYQAPFGMTVTLRPIETERRKFLQWEDGSKQKERTLTLRDDQEIKALWQRISPTGIEAIAAGSVIRGERGQLYIEVPEACDVTLYTYGGVPVRVARLAAGANRLANLNAGLYLVKLGAAPAVPVRIR